MKGLKPFIWCEALNDFLFFILFFVWTPSKFKYKRGKPFE